MSLQDLYIAVYESPSDDGRRRVLADALLEAGDVRGELIALQYETHALARKRANKLIERHRAHFLGPLSDVVLHGSDRWEHGFLVGCSARLSGDTVACPAWATVRSLTVVGGGLLDPDELGSKWMRSLREVFVISAESNWWVREHELDRSRARVLGVLREANRLRVFKS